MLKRILAHGIFLLFWLSTSGALSSIYAWQELKSEHFIVYYTKEEKFAREVSEKAERYYRNIASDLGYPRYSDFWTWDKRVKIYIYADSASYLKATGHPAWSQGMADYTNKSIATYEFSSEFMDGLLPHELAHLIFRDFVGFKGEVPLWLDEGVAQWEESVKRKHIKEMGRYLYDSGATIPLREMMNIDIRGMKDERFINTYYLQAVTLVGFLIETYGSLAFADFCRQLRDGKSMDDALRSAYGIRLKNLDDMEAKWTNYLKNLNP